MIDNIISVIDVRKGVVATGGCAVDATEKGSTNVAGNTCSYSENSYVKGYTCKS